MRKKTIKKIRKLKFKKTKKVKGGVNFKPLILTSLFTDLNPNSQYSNSRNLENRNTIIDDLIVKCIRKLYYFFSK